MSKENRFPPGWDEARVKQILGHYESQAEEEAVLEDEAAFVSSETTMSIPHELVPEVRKLIAKSKSGV